MTSRSHEHRDGRDLSARHDYFKIILSLFSSLFPLFIIAPVACISYMWLSSLSF